MATQTIQTPTKSVPHIIELPLIGSLPEHTKDRLSLYLQVAQQCGDVGSFHFGPFRVIFFNTSENVHRVFVEHANDFDKGAASERTSPLKGEASTPLRALAASQPKVFCVLLQGY